MRKLLLPRTYSLANYNSLISSNNLYIFNTMCNVFFAQFNLLKYFCVLKEPDFKTFCFFIEKNKKVLDICKSFDILYKVTLNNPLDIFGLMDYDKFDPEMSLFVDVVQGAFSVVLRPAIVFSSDYWKFCYVDMFNFITVFKKIVIKPEFFERSKRNGFII